MHYKGTLEDGTEFDSSYSRGPLSFPIGTGRVIQGWDQGLLGKLTATAAPWRMHADLDSDRL